MKKFKWSFGFAVLGFGIAYILNLAATREYTAFHDAHPGAFYHGNSFYTPVFDQISICLNAPAWVGFLSLREVYPYLHYTDRAGLYGRFEYFVAVALLWAWMGATLVDGFRPPRYWPSVWELALGVSFTLLLAYFAIDDFRYSISNGYRYAIPIGEAIWATLLTCYFSSTFWGPNAQNK
jgi:hypothetical protein